MEDKTRICPVEYSGSLDNKWRKWFQNPQKILAPYLKLGMKVLDIGCGPGFFSIEIAKMIGENGKVYSVDLQEGMLNIIKNKIAGTELESRIQLIKSSGDGFNIPEKVDLILAFYMVHEVPDKENLFSLLKSFLNDNGKFLLLNLHSFMYLKRNLNHLYRKLLIPDLKLQMDQN